MVFRRPLLGFAFAVAALGAGTSCALDPVHDAKLTELGPERPELYPPESALHRPGEPCLTCHGQKGPADSQFYMGGTIYWSRKKDGPPAGNVYVRIVDANNTNWCAVTNCNGNFWFAPRQDRRPIAYPVLTSIELTVEPEKNEATKALRRMSSHIGREGSCAACHIRNLRDYASPGHIVLYDNDADLEGLSIPEKCPDESFTQIEKCPEDR